MTSDAVSAAGPRPPIRGLPPALAGLDRCLVMGIVNVTADSFSDGGAFLDPGEAVAHGLRLLSDGADMLDVGGESTRPGAQRVTPADELARVVPVVRDLVDAGAVVSVDTMRAATATAALAAGASLVNDVSGGLADADLPSVVAEAGVPYVVMHWRGHSRTMQALAAYDDVVRDVRDELSRRLDALGAAGVDLDQVILDPGLGFAKTPEHNWALLRQLDVLTQLGRPLLIGASRKSFLGELLADRAGNPRAVADREAATTALSALAAHAGAWAVRVHAVRPSADAVRVAAALQPTSVREPAREP